MKNYYTFTEILNIVSNLVPNLGADTLRYRIRKYENLYNQERIEIKKLTPGPGIEDFFPEPRIGKNKSTRYSSKFIFWYFTKDINWITEQTNLREEEVRLYLDTINDNSGLSQERQQYYQSLEKELYELKQDFISFQVWLKAKFGYELNYPYIAKQLKNNDFDKNDSNNIK